MNVDETHALDRTSWVPGAAGHPDFPIQNLPLCIFSAAGAAKRGGVAIGPWILDLAALAATGFLADDDRSLIELAARPALNAFLGLDAKARLRVRHTLSRILTSGSGADAYRNQLLVTRDNVTFDVPAEIGDYTDFFAGITHARNAGRIFRPDNALRPNYHHIPIAYHGRSSSIRTSGYPVTRPNGQTVAHGSITPAFGPSRRLDFECELAIWPSGGNALGKPIAISDAAARIAGFGLLNDWSARDIQEWESQPLGPFLGKNFLTTVSPFVVTTEALAPYRTSQPPRPVDEPQPLAYLHDDEDQASGAFAISLRVHIQTEIMRTRTLPPHPLTHVSALDLYWTPAQLLAHHTSNGCAIRPGDVFGSGTISSPQSDGHGSLLELTSGGRQPFTLPSGESRTFLEDGDEIILSAFCERDGFARIGFGEARGRVVSPG